MSPHQSPPLWDDTRFESDRQVAIEQFRAVRMQEPLEQYLVAFDKRRNAMENLLETTVDLSRLADEAADMLADPGTLEAVRYLAAPPISEDDLKVLAIASLAPSRVRSDPEMAKRVIETVMLGLDRSRFPWMGEDREPTEAERETAIVATSAMIAGRRVMTDRANESKSAQEGLVAAELLDMGFTQVPTRVITAMRDAPQPGEFCVESLFGTRKADLIVGLWDGRQMPVECKVSNSATNSVKRLNNDAAVKAKKWIEVFGTSGVVPTAVLSGVFKLHNLRAAQSDGLTIIWAHDLTPMRTFIESTKP